MPGPTDNTSGRIPRIFRRTGSSVCVGTLNTGPDTVERLIYENNAESAGLFGEASVNRESPWEFAISSAVRRFDNPNYTMKYSS